MIKIDLLIILALSTSIRRLCPYLATKDYFQWANVSSYHSHQNEHRVYRRLLITSYSNEQAVYWSCFKSMVSLVQTFQNQGLRTLLLCQTSFTTLFGDQPELTEAKLELIKNFALKLSHY